VAGPSPLVAESEASMLERPAPAEHDLYFAGYVAAVPAGDVLALLAAQPARLARLAAAAGGERERDRYAPGKWSVREIFGHLIDAERVFGYRAYRIGHGDATPLASFEQDGYVAAAGFDAIPLAEALAEFTAMRDANLRAIRRLLPDAAGRTGVAGGWPVSFRALVFILVGHVEHHLRVLAERYGLRG
jgi:hypothetical protein